MKWGKSFLLLIANALCCIAYRTWTYTKYYETYFSVTEISDPCETATSTTVFTQPGGTAVFTTTVRGTFTHCPFFITVQWGSDVVEVTPTTSTHGIASATYTATYGVYGAVFTVVDVAIGLPRVTLPVPSMTITTPPTVPTQDSRGQWRLNNTPVEFLQPVLLTAPASCSPSIVTSFIFATYTQSPYSFMSLVLVEPSIKEIIPQVVAAAVTTQLSIRTYEDLSAQTTIQYILPSDLFPVTSTASEYWSAADINPCIDPRATEDPAITTTTASSGGGGIRTPMRQAIILGILATTISTILLF